MKKGSGQVCSIQPSWTQWRKTFTRDSHPLGNAALAFRRGPQGETWVRLPAPQRKVLLNARSSSTRGPPHTPFLSLSAPAGPEVAQRGRVSPLPAAGSAAPRPTRAPRDRPAVLPPPGALWAAAGLVADAVAAAARMKGAAGWAQGVPARDRAAAAAAAAAASAAAMGKGSRPRADARPSVLGRGLGQARRTGGVGMEASGSGLGSEPGFGPGRGQPGTQGRPRSPWQRAAAPRSPPPPSPFRGLMAEVWWSVGLQGARTGPAGVQLPGRGRAMTFQVWGWRREASQLWAWVPDAEGGRRAAMPRRTPGEPSVRMLGAPRALGQPCWLGGREAGKGFYRQDAGTGPWARAGTAARAGRGWGANAPLLGSCRCPPGPTFEQL